jgi:hypothetical protein
MEIATRRDNVHLTDHGHQPALTKPEQPTLQTTKPVGGHGLTLTGKSRKQEANNQPVRAEIELERSTNS